MFDIEVKWFVGKKAHMLAGRERLEGLVRDLMILTGTSKAKSPAITITLSKESMTKVELTSPTEIPERFWSCPEPPSPQPMVAEIGRALKAGEEVPGARLVAAKRSLRVS